jgi:7-cyano-7-deazaguanine reductase
MSNTILEHVLEKSPLGKKLGYIDHYTPSLLYAVPRKLNRDELGITEQLPFKGVDVWDAFEASWLNTKGKPIVAIAEFIIPCTSPYLIESKSFKFYLNSFNQSTFQSIEEVKKILQKDLSEVAGETVEVKLTLANDYAPQLTRFEGYCLDQLDVNCDVYDVTPELLQVGKQYVDEIFYSHLLKSNCWVTGQPDWASIQICYTGKKIEQEGLLRYLVSFRNHSEFHEQCVERIFMDIMTRCQPEKLTVYARYTRRGGLDINPYRSTENKMPNNGRLARQ